MTTLHPAPAPAPSPAPSPSPAPLTTTFGLFTHAGDPPATVRIRNLQTTAPLRRAGRDAWGRAGKPQPCLLSAAVGFAAPFFFGSAAATAAARDRLGEDTVNYGTLSKALLGCVEEAEADAGAEAEAGAGVGNGNGNGEGNGKGGGGRAVSDVVAAAWRRLTGLEVDGSSAFVPRADEEGEKEKEALLDLTRVRYLSVTVALPKASLLGEGVSLTASAVFDASGKMEARAMALEITRLRVPTLIGVNANERLRKQFVIVTVTLDGFDQGDDVYVEVEGIVVKALEESSFETLEALGTHLTRRVLECSSSQDSWQVGIRMEKPTAVPMADYPVVEVKATRESLKRDRALGR